MKKGTVSPTPRKRGFVNDGDTVPFLKSYGKGTVSAKGTVSEKGPHFGERVPCHRDCTPNLDTPVPFFPAAPFPQCAYHGTLFAARPAPRKGYRVVIVGNRHFHDTHTTVPFFSARLPRYPFHNTLTTVPFRKGYRGPAYHGTLLAAKKWVPWYPHRISGGCICWIPRSWPLKRVPW